MEALPDERLQLDSAAEAGIIGRVAVYGNGEANGTKLVFYHEQEDGTTNDELEFLRREKAYGKLIIERRLAETAQTGLRAILKSGEAFNGITPNVAVLCLDAIHKSREVRVRRLDPVSEVSPTPVAA